MEALYQQVYQSIKADITNGKFQVGDRIPSEKELSEKFQVSRITSKKALEILMNEGYVYRQRGRGTFVDEFSTNQKKQPSDTKKPLFGLIVTSLDASFGNNLVTALTDDTDEGFFIILKISLGLPDKEEQLMQELMELGVDGMIVAPAHSDHYSSEILKMVVNKFPLVLIDRSIKGIGVTSVSTDNQEAAQTGVNYLFEIGHKHISVLMPSNYETTTIEDRIAGIVHAYAEKNVMVNKSQWHADIHSTLPYPLASKEEDIERIKKHIQKHPEITAIFALEYNIALLAKKAIEDLNLNVPEDISIICFDSPPYNDLELNFTHLKQNEKELGQKTIKRLMDMYKGELQIKKDEISATLVEGETPRTLKLSKQKEGH
ncbi:DNA-binding transcriptional regulator, LacI/PurR family [Gracilibacillus orientalis]|uniref:DNA-binding transcriptional regulator, LacI/PurR family n=1 Tax=Gracilibacillus orientalis TaxID=334253 RepID=A0A1I4HW39_9BACI|nr:LacI family DNA-binding transcriptional regulator [Gracilibacillus orientalis]SFL45626.1 DNA-binding transcriptional regulator, LacI/PurR family [Gracilibacillus orientalis]